MFVFESEVVGSIAGLAIFPLLHWPLKWWNLPLPGIRCCSRGKDFVWIGVISDSSAEDVGLQCSGTNADLEGENVVGCSVTGLGDYCPCQQVKLFGKVGSMFVFESEGCGFNPKPCSSSCATGILCIQYLSSSLSLLWSLCVTIITISGTSLCRCNDSPGY